VSEETRDPEIETWAPTYMHRGWASPLKAASVGAWQLFLPQLQAVVRWVPQPTAAADPAIWYRDMWFTTAISWTRRAF